ncbi:hypothetical protein Dimus_035912 [Dionaea muscipula]
MEVVGQTVEGSAAGVSRATCRCEPGGGIEVGDGREGVAIPLPVLRHFRSCSVVATSFFSALCLFSLASRLLLLSRYTTTLLSRSLTTLLSSSSQKRRRRDSKWRDSPVGNYIARRAKDRLETLCGKLCVGNFVYGSNSTPWWRLSRFPKNFDADQAILTVTTTVGGHFAPSIHEANLCTQKQRHSPDPIYRSRPARHHNKKAREAKQHHGKPTDHDHYGRPNNVTGS